MINGLHCVIQNIIFYGSRYYHRGDILDEDIMWLCSHFLTGYPEYRGDIQKLEFPPMIYVPTELSRQYTRLFVNLPICVVCSSISVPVLRPKALRITISKIPIPRESIADGFVVCSDSVPVGAPQTAGTSEKTSPLAPRTKISTLPEVYSLTGEFSIEKCARKCKMTCALLCSNRGLRRRILAPSRSHLS